MSELLKIKKIVTHKHLAGFRKFYENIEIHVGILRSLGRDDRSNGSFLTPRITERLPNYFKLNVS